MNDLTEKIHNSKVQFVLQKIEFIRKQILDDISRIHRLHASAIGSYGALIAFTWTQNKLEVLLVCSLLTTCFVLIWYYCQTMLEATSSFLMEEIERRKIVDLVGYRDKYPNDMPDNKTLYCHRNYWVSWQQYFYIGIPGHVGSWSIPLSVYILGLIITSVGIWKLLEKSNYDLVFSWETSLIVGSIIILSIAGYLIFKHICSGVRKVHSDIQKSIISICNTCDEKCIVDATQKK